MDGLRWPIGSSRDKDIFRIYVIRLTDPFARDSAEVSLCFRLGDRPKQAPEAAAWRQKVGKRVSLERGEERVEGFPEGFPKDAGGLDDTAAAFLAEALDDGQIVLGLTNQRREVHLGRVLRQPDAASFSAVRLEVAELAEPEHHLDHLVPIDGVALGDLVDRGEFAVLEPGIDEHAQAIISEGGETHLAAPRASPLTELIPY